MTISQGYKEQHNKAHEDNLTISMTWELPVSPVNQPTHREEFVKPCKKTRPDAKLPVMDPLERFPPQVSPQKSQFHTISNI